MTTGWLYWAGPTEQWVGASRRGEMRTRKVRTEFKLAAWGVLAILKFADDFLVVFGFQSVPINSVCTEGCDDGRSALGAR